MRYRRLAQPSSTNVFNFEAGDYVFGRGASNFWTNVPEAPAQAALTRLYLYLGDWFLDTSDGTAWETEVLGKFTKNTRDPVLRDRILGTQGVTGIATYSSDLNRDTRRFEVNANIDTIYGQVTVSGEV